MLQRMKIPQCKYIAVPVGKARGQDSSQAKGCRKTAASLRLTAILQFFGHDDTCVESNGVQTAIETGVFNFHTAVLYGN